MKAFSQVWQTSSNIFIFVLTSAPKKLREDIIKRFFSIWVQSIPRPKRTAKSESRWTLT